MNHIIVSPAESYGRIRKGAYVNGVNPAYGVVWKAKADRLSSCGLMQDYYEEFTAIEAARKSTRFWDRSERRRLRQEAKSLRKKGKAAWKQCEKIGKLAEARGEDPLMAQLATTSRVTVTERDPMYPDGVPEDYFPPAEAAAPVGYTDDNYEEEEGPNVLLWTGVGLGVLIGGAVIYKKFLKK